MNTCQKTNLLKKEQKNGNFHFRRRGFRKYDEQVQTRFNPILQNDWLIPYLDHDAMFLNTDTLILLYSHVVN